MTDVNFVTGNGATIDDQATVGYQYDDDVEPTVLGDDATVRAGTTIYADVEIGDDFVTGHNALVREYTHVGDEVVVGSGTVIDGTTIIGSNVSLQSQVYVPSNTEIGDDVFLGPNAVLTNDPYPVRQEMDLEGPTIEDHASIGANATVLPGVTVGEGSFVAAGAVITEDVPPDTLAMGVPAEHRSLPESLSGPNLLR